MRYYRLVNSIGDVCLSAETGEGILENITSVEDDVTDILDLIKASFISGESIDDLTRRILDSGDSEKISTRSDMKIWRAVVSKMLRIL